MRAFRTLAWGMLYSFAGLVSGIGLATLKAFSTISYIIAVIGGVLVLAVRPSSWPRTIRSVLARQIFFTAVESLGFCLRISFAVGILVIVQAQLWVYTVGGGSELLGPFLLKVVVRELGPMLANFLVIVRSGNAIATELGNMRLAGEVDLLDAQGIDPMTYLVMPRVLGVSCSVFCLAVVFVVSTFLCGYVVAMLMGLIAGNPMAYFADILDSVTIEDLIFFLPKTLIAGAMIGAIPCIEGLSVGRAWTEVPQAASRSAVRSLTAVFAVSALLSLLIYGRILIFQV